MEHSSFAASPSVKQARVFCLRYHEHERWFPPDFSESGRVLWLMQVGTSACNGEVVMKSFLMSFLRAAIFLGFVFLMTGCSDGTLVAGGPTPTPSPGNAFVYTANAGGNSIS